MNTYHDLAEAMRKGAALRPQATSGQYFMPLTYGSNVTHFASCALGAAWEGTSGPFVTWGEALDTFSDTILATIYPCLDDTSAGCPIAECDGGEHYPVDDYPVVVEWMINHLNEDHKLPREVISDWLDTR